MDKSNQITTNLFKIYSDDGITINTFDSICNKIEDINKLLDEDICESAILESEPNYFDEKYLQKLNEKITFNIVDLIPMETLRRCADSLAHNIALQINEDFSETLSQPESESESASISNIYGGANSNNLMLTDENQISNFIDQILTGTNGREEIQLSENENENIDLEETQLEVEETNNTINVLNKLESLIKICIYAMTNSNNNSETNISETNTIETNNININEEINAIETTSTSEFNSSKNNTFSEISGESRVPDNILKKKYFYNDLFYYCYLYYILSELIDSNPNEIFLLNTTTYIYTYLILLILMPNITTYLSSTKIRRYLLIESELYNLLENIDKLLLNSFNQDAILNTNEMEIKIIGGIITLFNHKANINELNNLTTPLSPNINNINKPMPISPSISETSNASVPSNASIPSNASVPSNASIPSNITAPVGEGTNLNPDLLNITSPGYLNQEQNLNREQNKITISQPLKLPENIGSLDPNIASQDQGISSLFKGGSCKHIDLRNELLFIKFLFEWSHDFGPSRAMVYVNGDYDYKDNNNFYTEKGIFQTISHGWENIIKKEELQINNKYTNMDIEVDKEIFKRLKNARHEESTYIYNIIDALMIYCSNIKANLLYIPIVEFTCKTKENNTKDIESFFNNIFKYYNNQRMFIKDDDTINNIHLSITSDNTPNKDIPEINFGKNMQDMNLDPMAIALITQRKELYTQWDNLIENYPNLIKNPNINLLKETIFNKNNNSFQNITGQIISNVKTTQTQQIRTVAKMLDPLPSGKFTIEDINGNQIISQNLNGIDNNENKLILNNALKIATIYGINQLLNVWIDNSMIIEDYEYIIENNEINAIKFKTTSQINKSFDWYYGICTVNIICGALINVSINANNKYNTNISDLKNRENLFNVNTNFANNIKLDTKLKEKLKQQWEQIYNIVNFILDYDGFKFEKTVQTVLMIIAYLKSCGDEYQRLTCEAMNYLLNNNKEDLIKNVNINNFDINSLKNILGSTVFFLTKDRILIGESIEKNTPLFTNLKTPHEAFYDDVEVAENFYNQSQEINGNYLTKKSIGLMSNRRDVLSSAAVIDYSKKVNENNEKIINLFKAIMLKTNPENYNNPNTYGDNKTIYQIIEDTTNYYIQLQYNININKQENVNSIIENIINKNSNTQSEIDSDITRISNNLGEILSQSNNELLTQLTQASQTSEGTVFLDSIPENDLIIKYEIQMDIISNLSKLLLALEYYNAASETKMKTFYETSINAEISKSISTTIDSNMINMITLKNSCKLPTTTDGLSKLLEKMIDEPEVIDKLLDSYNKANEIFINKLTMYKTIISNFNYNLENKQKNNDLNIEWNINDLMTSYLNNIFGDKIRNDVITKYNDYLTYIDATKDLFGEKVLSDIKTKMESESRRLERSRSRTGERVTYFSENENAEELKEQIIQELENYFKEKNELEQEKLKKEQEILEADQLLIKNKGKKNIIQQLKGFLFDSLADIKKMITGTKKDIRTIDGRLKLISTNIQKLTEKKQKIEIKDVQRTKVFGYETLKNAFNYLLGRRSTGATNLTIDTTVENTDSSTGITPGLKNVELFTPGTGKRKTTELEEEIISPTESPTKKQKQTPLEFGGKGKTLKQKRRHYSTKRTKLTNNKKHTKYMKKKILRKTRTK